MENDQQVIEQGNIREVRFAVVMYGGVSLAIYINGVAQELLKMCRATVSKNKTGDLKSTEKIYRQISALMANEKLVEQIIQILPKPAGDNETNEERKKREETERNIEKILDDLITPDDRPLTKFVVDVLTGTSAGGINAIFLAKALANNQNIAQLKDMWLNEGDIKVLINDKKSVEKTGLSVPDSAKSLLNSQRMYLKLLEAFDGMGADQAGESNYTEEIDLFVPITDFRGVVVPVRLVDKVVREKRHGQVFRFRYEKGKTNDFKDNNPMLAFAARTTSSFPFAFEPMRLSQAYSVIEEGFEKWEEITENLKKNHEIFFPRLIEERESEKNQEPKLIDWTERDLVDGGILDNKPFGYAIDVLSERRADFLCERKLLYIEPSPENFSHTKAKDTKNAPNVIQNAVASLSSIPSYETIREDLERLLERNSLIERITELIKKSEKDVFEYLMQNPDKKYELPYKGEVWEAMGLEDIVKWKGLAVLPYYRLRIADLTDEIARLVSQLNAIEEKSENFLIIRDFVKAWRSKHYSFYQSTKDADQKTILAFLRSFDMKFRLRRLRFVQEKLNLLYRFTKEFREDLTVRKDNFKQITKKESEIKDVNKQTRNEHPFVEQHIDVSQKFLAAFEEPSNTKNGGTVKKRPTEIIWLVSQEIEKEEEIGIKKIRLTANYFVSELNRIFTKLQADKENLFSKRNEDRQTLSLSDRENKSEKLNSAAKKLQKVFEEFKKKNDKDRAEIANNDEKNKQLKDKSPEVFNEIESSANELFDALSESFQTSRNAIAKLFDVYEILPDELQNKGVELDLVNAVRGYLEHYYESFDEYDQLSFPSLYETQVGEAVKVDVMRISPQDATSLIDERGEKRQKLAGESLFHFGAFLDRVWRFNDILWGRLDGVERLITALLPDKKYENLRVFLTKKAHLEILKEDMLTSNRGEIQTQLLKNLLEKSAGIESKSASAIVTGEFMDDKIQERVDNILQKSLEPESAYQFIKNNHDAQNRLEPKELLRVISRSTKVTGDIFEGIADKDSQLGSRLRWISRLGLIFWGLVEVAAPNSFWNLLFQHWLTLIYFFEVVLLIGSTIFVKPEVQQFATVLLILTLIVNLTTVELNSLMKGGKFGGLIRFVAIGFFAILTIVGGIFIYSFFYDAGFWEAIDKKQKLFSQQEHYLKLFPVALLITIFAAMLTWRETENVRVKFFGAVSVLFTLAAVIFGVFFYYITKDASGINGLGAVLSLEFAREIKDVTVITNDYTDAARNGLKLALAIDSFLFVPLYTGFLLVFNRLFNLRNWRSKKYLMSAAAICIIVAALADLSENIFSYSVLATKPDELTRLAISGIWILASIKWFLLSFVTAILSLIFWRKGWWTFFTVGFLFTAVCGIVGISDHKFIQYFTVLQLSLLLAVGLIFWFFPDKFKREF
jgi:patatin-related protein